MRKSSRNCQVFFIATAYIVGAMLGSRAIAQNYISGGNQPIEVKSELGKPKFQSVVEYERLYRQLQEIKSPRAWLVLGDIMEKARSQPEFMKMARGLPLPEQGSLLNYVNRYQAGEEVLQGRYLFTKGFVKDLGMLTQNTTLGRTRHETLNVETIRGAFSDLGKVSPEMAQAARKSEPRFLADRAAAENRPSTGPHEINLESQERAGARAAAERARTVPQDEDLRNLSLEPRNAGTEVEAQPQSTKPAPGNKVISAIPEDEWEAMQDGRRARQVPNDPDFKNQPIEPPKPRAEPVGEAKLPPGQYVMRACDLTAVTRVIDQFTNGVK